MKASHSPPVMKRVNTRLSIFLLHSLVVYLHFFIGNEQLNGLVVTVHVSLCTTLPFYEPSRTVNRIVVGGERKFPASFPVVDTPWLCAFTITKPHRNIKVSKKLFSMLVVLDQRGDESLVR